MEIRAVVSLFFTALLLSSSLIAVRANSVEEVDVAETGGELGIVGEDAQIYTDGTFTSAPGVETLCVFPKNIGKIVPAGEPTDLLVGVQNEGESTLEVFAIKASIHLPVDHRMFVQNLTAQEFYNASVPVSIQATFPYTFTVSKYLQPGSFDLVGTIIYKIDEQPYQTVFYNGTVEVVEAGGLLSIESVFLVTLGVALIVLLGIWAYNQIQRFSKKTKRAPKVEVGTGATEADMDDWLKGTAYAQSISSKLKKKK